MREIAQRPSGPTAAEGDFMLLPESGRGTPGDRAAEKIDYDAPSQARVWHEGAHPTSLAGTAGRARPVPPRARTPGPLISGKNENPGFFFSQIFKPEMTSIPYGHNEHSLLRHHIRPRLHDRPHHHEDHARLLGKAQGLPED